MRRTWIVVTTIMMFAPGADAQERPAFHVAVFPDNRTVSLAIAGAVVPADRQYDFQVDVDLTERASGGAVVFADHGAHAVRVRCQEPAAVKVGGVVHLMVAQASADWMRDLWKALCQQPVS